MIFPIGRLRLPFVVVGTGRCGTVHVASLLTAVGLPCGHERLFGPEGLNSAIQHLREGGKDSEVAKNSGLTVPASYVVAEASYMAVPYLDHSILADATIIHVIRDPIKVILSFSNKLQYWHHSSHNQWERFILSHLPSINKQPTPLAKNVHYVVAWNRWIEKQSLGRKYIRIKIEDGDEPLLNFLGTPCRPKVTATNDHDGWRHKMPPLSNPAYPEDVLAFDEVKSLAADYDY